MNKKNRLVTLIVLIIVLVLAAGLVVYLNKDKIGKQAETETTEEESKEKLISDAPESFSKFSYHTEGFDLLSFEKGSQGWVLDQDPTCPLDQERITAMIRALGKISIVKTLEAVDDEAMGFNSPYIYVTYTADGREKFINIGKLNATGDAFYCKVSDSEKAYLIGSSIRFSYERDVLALVKKDELPTFSEVGVVTFDVVYQGKHQEFTYFMQDSGYPAYKNLIGMPTSSNMMQSFMNKMEEIKIRDTVAYNVVTKDLESDKYGFNEPDAVFRLEYEDASGAAKTFGLTVGAVDRTETDTSNVKHTYRYAYLDGTNRVYTVEEEAYREMADYLFQE